MYENFVCFVGIGIDRYRKSTRPLSWKQRSELVPLMWGSFPRVTFPYWLSKLKIKKAKIHLDSVMPYRVRVLYMTLPPNYVHSNNLPFGSMQRFKINWFPYFPTRPDYFGRWFHESQWRDRISGLVENHSQAKNPVMSKLIDWIFNSLARAWFEDQKMYILPSVTMAEIDSGWLQIIPV